MAQPNDAGLGGGKLSADQRAKMEALRQAMQAKAAQYTAPRPKSSTSSSAYDPLSSANTGKPAAKPTAAAGTPSPEEAIRQRRPAPAPVAPPKPVIPTVQARPSAPQRQDIPSTGYSFTDGSYTGKTWQERAREVDNAQMSAQANPYRPRPEPEAPASGQLAQAAPPALRPNGNGTFSILNGAEELGRATVNAARPYQPPAPEPDKPKGVLGSAAEWFDASQTLTNPVWRNTKRAWNDLTGAGEQLANAWANVPEEQKQGIVQGAVEGAQTFGQTFATQPMFWGLAAGPYALNAALGGAQMPQAPQVPELPQYTFPELPTPTGNATPQQRMAEIAAAPSGELVNQAGQAFDQWWGQQPWRDYWEDTKKGTMEAAQSIGVADDLAALFGAGWATFVTGVKEVTTTKLGDLANMAPVNPMSVAATTAFRALDEMGAGDLTVGMGLSTVAAPLTAALWQELGQKPDQRYAAGVAPGSSPAEATRQIWVNLPAEVQQDVRDWLTFNENYTNTPGDNMMQVLAESGFGNAAKGKQQLLDKANAPAKKEEAEAIYQESERLLDEVVNNPSVPWQQRADAKIEAMNLAKQANEMFNAAQDAQTKSYGDIFNENADWRAELFTGILLDPFNLLDFPADLITNTLRAARTAARMVDVGRAASEMKLGLNAGAAVAETLAKGLTPTNAQKAVIGIEGLQGRGWLSRLLGYTGDTEAHKDASAALQVGSQLFQGVDNAADATRLIDVLLNSPQQLLDGVKGLTGEYYKFMPDVRFGPSLVAGENAQRMYRLLEAARPQLTAMRSLKDPATFNLMEFMAEWDSIFYKKARQVRGLTLLDDIPVGAVDVKAVPAAADAAAIAPPDAQFAVAFFDKAGKRLEATAPKAPMTQQQADAYVKAVRDAVEAGKANPVNQVVMKTASIQRAFLADMWLNLRPGHWIRNATAAMAATMSDGLLAFDDVADMTDGLARKFAASSPTERVGSALTGNVRNIEAGEIGSDKNWTRGMWKTGNPYAAANEWGQKLWTGMATVLGTNIPFGEQAFYTRAYYKGFQRAFASAWDDVIYQGFGAKLRELQVPKPIADSILNRLRSAGVTGSKADVAKAAREAIMGASLAFDMRALKIDDEVISLDGWKALDDVLQGYAKGTQEDAAAIADIKRIIGEEKTRYRQMLAEALPQSTVESTANTITADAAAKLDDLTQAGIEAGIPPDEARAIAKEATERTVAAEVNGWQKFIGELGTTATDTADEAGATINHDAMIVAFDLMAENYDLRRLAQIEVDKLSKAAAAASPATRKSAWNIKWFSTQEIYEKLALDQQAAFDGAVTRLRQLVAGEPIEKQYDWWKVINRYTDFDEEKLAEARAVEIGSTRTTPQADWDKVIDANRQYIDTSYVLLFEAWRKFPDLDGLDLIRNTEREIDIIGNQAAAFLKPKRDALWAKTEAGTIKKGEWDAYFALRNRAWNRAFDKQVMANRSAAQAIIANGLAAEVPSKLRWTEDFGGRYADEAKTIWQPVEYMLIGMRDDGLWRVRDIQQNETLYLAGDGAPNLTRMRAILLERMTPNPKAKGRGPINPLDSQIGIEVMRLLDAQAAGQALPADVPAPVAAAYRELFDQATDEQAWSVPQNVIDDFYKVTGEYNRKVAQEMAEIDERIGTAAPARSAQDILDAADLTPEDLTPAQREQYEALQAIQNQQAYNRAAQQAIAPAQELPEAQAAQPNVIIPPAAPDAAYAEGRRVFDSMTPQQRAAELQGMTMGEQAGVGDSKNYGRGWMDAYREQAPGYRNAFTPEQEAERFPELAAAPPQAATPPASAITPAAAPSPAAPAPASPGYAQPTAANFRGLMQQVYRLDDARADAVDRLAQARARVWARQTGRSADEWVGAHFAGIVQGGEVDPEALYQRMVQTPEFRQWFDGAADVVKEADGAPKRFYHGTGAGEIEAFDVARQSPDSLYGPGFYFTEDPDIASGIRGAALTDATDPDKAAQLDAGYAWASPQWELMQPLTKRQLYNARRWFLSDRIMAEGRADMGTSRRLRDGWLALEDSPEAFAKWLAGNSTELRAQLKVERRLLTQPNAVPVHLNVKNPFDVNATYTRDELQTRFPDALDDLRTNTVKSNGSMSGERVLYALRQKAIRENTGIHENVTVNQWLRDAGYDGITHIGGNNYGRAPHRVVIAFEPNQVKSIFNPTPTSDPRLLRQLAANAQAKGAAEFLDDGRAILRGLTAPDVSTAVHEMAHVFRRDLTLVARMDEKAAADVIEMRKWVGLKPGEAWTRKAEEQFSRGFETYLKTGQAPTPELASVFARFKEWLTEIYRAFKGEADPKITAKMRGVYDRLLADAPAGAKLDLTPKPRPQGPTTPTTGDIFKYSWPESEQAQQTFDAAMEAKASMLVQWDRDVKGHWPNVGELSDLVKRFYRVATDTVNMRGDVNVRMLDKLFADVYGTDFPGYGPINDLGDIENIVKQYVDAGKDIKAAKQELTNLNRWLGQKPADLVESVRPELEGYAFTPDDIASLAQQDKQVILDTLAALRGMDTGNMPTVGGVMPDFADDVALDAAPAPAAAMPEPVAPAPAAPQLSPEAAAARAQALQAEQAQLDEAAQAARDGLWRELNAAPEEAPPIDEPFDIDMAALPEMDMGAPPVAAIPRIERPTVTATTLNELAAGSGIATATEDGRTTHRHLINAIRKDAKENGAGWTLPTSLIKTKKGTLIEVTTERDFIAWVQEQPQQAEQAAEWLAERVEDAARLQMEPKAVKAPKPKKGKAPTVTAAPAPEVVAAPEPAALPEPQIMEPAPPLPPVIQQRMGAEGNAYMEARAAEVAAPVTAAPENVITPAEQAPATTVSQQQAQQLLELMPSNGPSWVAGEGNLHFRQDAIEVLTGVKPAKSKARVKDSVAALVKALGIDDSTLAPIEVDELVMKRLNAIAKGETAPPAAPLATDATGQGLMLPNGEGSSLFDNVPVQAQGAGAFTPTDVQRQEGLIDMRPQFGADEPTYAPTAEALPSPAPLRTVTDDMRDGFMATADEARQTRVRLLLTDKPPRPEYKGMTRREFAEQAYGEGKTAEKRGGLWYIGDTEVTTTEANYLQHLETKAAGTPAWAQNQTGAPVVITLTVEGEANTQARVYQSLTGPQAGKWAVDIRDLDANEQIGTTFYPTQEQANAAAEEYGRRSMGEAAAPTTEAPRLGGEVAPAPVAVIPPTYERMSLEAVEGLGTDIGDIVGSAAPAAPAAKVWAISDNGKIQLNLTKGEMAALDPGVQGDIKRYYLWSPTRKAYISKGKEDNYTARQIAKRAGFADPKAKPAPAVDAAFAVKPSAAPLQRTDLPNETRLLDPRTGDEVVIRRTEDNRWQAKVTDSSASSGYISLAQAEQWAQNYLDNSADLAVKMDANKAAGAGPYSVPTGNQPAGRKMLGLNADGEAIYEDANGVRSYVNANGIGMTESVRLIPNRAGGYDYGVGGERSARFMTQVELAAQAPAQAPAAEIRQNINAAIQSLEAERAAQAVDDAQYVAEQQAIGGKLVELEQAEQEAVLRQAEGVDAPDARQFDKLPDARSSSSVESSDAGTKFNIYELRTGSATEYQAVWRKQKVYSPVFTDVMGAHNWIDEYNANRRMAQPVDVGAPRIEGIQNADNGAIMDAGGLQDAADRGRTDAGDDPALEELSARVGGQPRGQRGTRGTSAQSSAGDARPRSPASEGGAAPDGSVPTDAERLVLPRPEGLGGTRTGIEKAPSVDADGGTVIPERLDDNTGTGATVKAGAVDGTQPPAGHNYRITDDDNLESFGGPKTRYKSNIAAVRLLKQLESEGRLATPAEQKILARFSGWGESTLAQQLFQGDLNRVKPEWRNEWQELRTLLTPDELEGSNRTVVNAHYTRPAVIRPLYAALERLGANKLNQIRFLEPAMGIGNVLGLMPSSWLDKTQRIGVEIDTITAALAKHLYQNDRILRTGFQSAPIPDDFVDIALTNVPFGNYGVFDPVYKGRAYNYLVGSIHNYYFAKMLDKTRPGGIVAAITSRYTMDSIDPRVRALIASRADLLGAIRLPQSTFKANAGTEVVTDVLFLRKRLPGEEPGGIAWLNTPDVDVKGQKFPVNEYYHANPRNVLGTHSDRGTMFPRNRYTVEPIAGADISDQIATFAATLPENVISPRSASDVGMEAMDEMGQIRTQGLKQGAIIIKDGELVRVEKNALVPLAVDKIDAARARMLVELKDKLNAVRAANLTGADDATLTAAQKALRQTYDDLVKKFGKVNGSGNVRVFSTDPDLYNLRALELSDGNLADIFTKRLTAGERIPTKIDNALDALAVVLRNQGRMDIDRLQTLTGKNPDQLMTELGDLIFEDPNGAWLTKDAYLSGNIREKLRLAEAAAAADPKYQRNVDALRAAQPKDLLPSQITVTLGQNWLPPEVYKRFFKETFGDDIDISYHQELGWRVGNVSGKAKDSVGSSRWGSSRVPGATLFDHGMNSTNPKVYNPYEVTDANGTVTVIRELDRGATEAASVALDALHNEFQRWLWQGDLAPEMVTRYNQMRNVFVGGKPDGSHLANKLPGMNADWFDMRPNQKNGVWRALTRGNTLLAHEVGAGKTGTLYGIGMEWKRTGMANKPMMVAPNKLIAQHAQDFRKQYPLGRIITPNMKGLSASERKALMAQIANNDWDLVLIPQSQFGLLPMSKQYEEAYIKREIAIWREVLNVAREAAAAGLGLRVRDVEAAVDRDPTVKQITRNLLSYETKLEAMIALKRDDVIDFESLGVDALLVDEAHDYKNLPFATSNGDVVSGDAIRAIDMHMKVNYINEQSKYRNVVFATGTPLTNSIAETWTMMRYLMPQELESQMFGQFNPWGASYGRMAPKWELNVATGQWQTKNRFADFNNAPELHAMWQNTMDVMRSEDMPWIKLPEIKTGGRQVITSEPTEVYSQIQQELAARAEAIAQRHGPPQEGDDIILSVINSANAAAVDVRLYNPKLPDQPTSKANKMLAEAMRIYEYSTPHKGAQLIFADIGVPGGANQFNLYDDIKKKLIAKGVPEKEIAFIHDATDDVGQLAIYDKVKTGEIRFLIGSTEKMGKGANMQERLIALHHLSGKYRPDEILQREGRIIRSGNIFTELGIPVEIMVYVQQPLDAFMWGRVETKIRSINKMVQRELLDRTLTEIDEEEISFAMIAAAAGGDPRMFELRQMESDLSKIKALYNDHLDRGYSIRADANRSRADVKANQEAQAFVNERVRAKLRFVGEDNYITISPEPKVNRYAYKPIDVLASALAEPSEQVRRTLEAGDPIMVTYLGSQYGVAPRTKQVFQYGKDGRTLKDANGNWLTKDVPIWSVSWQPNERMKLARADDWFYLGRSDGPQFSFDMTADPEADAQTMLDRIQAFASRDLALMDRRLLDKIEEMTPKAEQLEAVANEPFARYDELRQMETELEALRTEMNGTGGGQAVTLPGQSEQDMRARWPLLAPKDLSTAKRLSARDAPGYRHQWDVSTLGANQWVWQSNGPSQVIGMRDYKWPNTYTNYWRDKDADATDLANAVAPAADMIDLRPIATHAPKTKNTDKAVILGDNQGNIAFINARDYSMILDNAAKGTWGEGNLRWTKRPGQNVVVRAGDEPVAVLQAYSYPTELEKIQRQHYPGAEQGMTTMYGGFGAIDPRAMFNAYGSLYNRTKTLSDNILRNWRKPKDPEVADVALHMVKTLDDAQDRLIASLPGLRKPQPNNLTAFQRNQLIDHVDKTVLPQFDDTVYASSRMGEELANGAMLNYRDRRGFDQILSLVFPFHYFWTRGGLSWAQRMARKPSLANTYYELERAINRENENGNLPSRLQGTIFTYRDANGQWRMQNPLMFALPFAQYMPNRWQDPEDSSNALEQWWLRLKQYTPGFLPAIEWGSAAILDQVAPNPQGDPSRISELAQGRRYVPALGMFADAKQAITGETTSPYWGGDNFDQYRVKRSIADLAQSGALGADKDKAAYIAQNAQQIALNIERGVDRYTNITQGDREAAEAAYTEASKVAGRGRALSSYGGYFTGANQYYLPDSEQQLAQLNTDYQKAGYEFPTQPYGSNAQRIDLIENNPALTVTWSKSTGPDEADPATAARKAQYYNARDGLYAAKQTAVDAALSANPNLTSKQMQDIVGPYYDELEALEIAAATQEYALTNPGATPADLERHAAILKERIDKGDDISGELNYGAPSLRPPTGANDRERATWVLENQLRVEGKPVWPGDDATKAQVNAYYKELDAWKVVRDKTIATRLDNLRKILSVNPSADLMKMFDLIRGMTPAEIVLEFQTIKFASEIEKDWQRAKFKKDQQPYRSYGRSSYYKSSYKKKYYSRRSYGGYGRSYGGGGWGSGGWADDPKSPYMPDVYARDFDRNLWQTASELERWQPAYPGQNEADAWRPARYTRATGY